MPETVLIVDDDPVQRGLLEAAVRRLGYETIAADGGDVALKLLVGADAGHIDCVLLDLVMPDLDGLGVLTRLRKAGCGIPVIVQTAQSGIDHVASAMHAGAVDFVVKPLCAERLRVSLRNALAAHAVAGELQRTHRYRDGTVTLADVMTRCDAMRPVMRAAEKASASGIPVLLEGEVGTGKTLLVRAIHGSSMRRRKPFVAVNCRAVPKNLMESILFGDGKDAFTHAIHKSKFAEANGGTLFLDDVDELPLPAQAKLLRVLQEAERDVRVIAATRRNLIAEIKRGRFREDLFYRLHALPIVLPPLRQRGADIAELAKRFLARMAAEQGKYVRAIDAEALALLNRHRWPGNVGELENTIFRAVALAESDEIGVNEFPQLVTRINRDDRDTFASLPLIEPSPSIAVFCSHENGNADSMVHDSQASIKSGPTLNLTDSGGEIRPLQEIESDAIRLAISHYRGHMSEAARRLKIGRSTLYRKLDHPE